MINLHLKILLLVFDPHQSDEDYERQFETVVSTILLFSGLLHTTYDITLAGLAAERQKCVATQTMRSKTSWNQKQRNQFSSVSSVNVWALVLILVPDLQKSRGAWHQGAPAVVLALLATYRQGHDLQCCRYRPWNTTESLGKSQHTL